MAKQLIKMQELPCGVFQFQNIVNIRTRGKLLAIASVDCYNNDLDSFPLSVADLVDRTTIFLVRDCGVCNIHDFSPYNENTSLDRDNEMLIDAFYDVEYLVLFDPITGDRVPC